MGISTYARTNPNAPTAPLRFGSAGTLAATTAPNVSFGDVLRGRGGGPTDLQPESREAKAHRVAQQLVAATFIKPLFSQMRHDPFRSKLFHGGEAEEQFGGQLDTILADRIAARTNFSLVGAVEREITHRGEPAAASAATAATATPNAGAFMPTTSGVHFDAHG